MPRLFYRKTAGVRVHIRNPTIITIFLVASVLLVGSLLGGQQSDTSNQTKSGWYLRPPDVGNYKDVIDFPGVDQVPRLRPPTNRNLRRLCEMKPQAFRTLIFDNERKLEALEAQKPTELDPEILQMPISYHRLGNLRAYEGDMKKAIENLEASYRIINDNSDLFPGAKAGMLIIEEQLGVAHLRRGELENCQLNHNAEMCIFPLSVAARHKLTSGSEQAIEHFKKYLDRDPENLEVRWLLNIAHMTLGGYPRDVPKEYLIPPAAFESKENIGRFVDVAASAGLNTVGNAGGVIVDDFDNDGFLDVVISSVDPCESLHYYHHNGDGTFSDRTVEAKLSHQLGGINLNQTDYNNDGLLDIFVMRGGWEYPTYNSLLRNNGDGTFTDVTKQSELESGPYRTHSAAWADFDNDGWVDLYIGHENAPSQLFRNKGNGTFEDVSHSAGLDRVAFTKGAAWGDYDNDGYPDLYVSNFGGENFLFHNIRNATFTEVAKQLHVEKPIMSFSIWFFDYDNDGWLDIFVASYVPSVTEIARGYLGLPPQAETMKLYRNIGNGTFQDVAKDVGLDRVIPTMGANFGDLDNDGFLDFYLGTGAPSYAALMPNFMFRNHEGKYFVDVTSSTGTGHLQKGHGIAFSDINNDGDQDVFINIGGPAPGDKYYKALFKNPGHGNNWISIKLVGVKSNRPAIGAKIKLTLEGEGSPEDLRHREVSSGGSFGSSTLVQAIGLGKASRIKTLEVWWPASKTRQTFYDVKINQFIEVKEFEKTYAKRQLRSFALGQKTKPTHRHMQDRE
ncbi:hypothetical protein BH18ACI4_BH18ACI4_20170 [soil metagenome]